MNGYRNGRSMATKVERRRTTPTSRYRIRPSDIAFAFAVSFALTTLLVVTFALVAKALS